jgi:uncharacterized protein (TIGR03083 family)
LTLLLIAGYTYCYEQYHDRDQLVDLDSDLQVILDGIEARRAFVASLVRAGTDPSQRVAGLDWTVGELNAHLVSTAANYSRMAAGEVVVTVSVSDRREAIDAGIAEHAGSTAAEDAARLEAGLDQLVATLRRSTDADRMPFYGMQAPPSLIAGMFLNELLVHGVDLARTHGRPVDVPDRAAYEALLATSSLTSFVLTPWGRTRSMVLGYAARGYAPIIVAFDHGDVIVGHRSDRKVDAWCGGSAADILLASFNRASAVRALRILRFRGRRPYLALTVARAFDTA